MPNLNHLFHMTDPQGLLQFSRGSCPNSESGYTLDDNARALIVTLYLKDGYPWASIYAQNLFRAQRPNGTWSNFSLNGQYVSTWDSEDSVGRGLLACSLGTLCSWPDIRQICNEMLNHNLHRAEKFTSPRAIAYTVLALSKVNLDNEKKVLAQKLSDALISLYLFKQEGRWFWFEDYLTYCNGILPHALLSSYQITGDKRALKIGRDSLNFLNDVLFRKGFLNIIGNRGWYQKGGNIAVFDQQPVDAASIAFACHEAYQVLGSNEYRDLSEAACLWYKGHNLLKMQLIDHHTGGCYDALTPDGVNLNQGAEAVLSSILSDMLMEGLLSLPEDNSGQYFSI